MKKTLLYFAIIFSINISFGQNIVNISPGAGTPISDSIANYNGDTLTEDLIFNLQDGVYSEDIVISNIVANASARIIIKSASNNPNSVLIEGVDNGYGGTIQLETSYVTLKNITIQSNNSYAIFFNLMQFNTIGNIIIDSCIIKNIASDYNNSVIYFDSPKEESNGNVISNCSIENGRVGVDIMDGYGWIKNLEIINNTFSGQYDAAINVVNVENIIVNNNNIQLGINNFDTYSIHKGINLDGVSSNNIGLMRCEISSNSISSTIDTVRYAAINLYNCTNMNGGKFYVKNNFIDIENTDSLAIGIRIIRSDSIYVLHNSIKLLSLRATGVFYDNMFAKAPFHLFFKNNIIQTDSVVFAATSSMSIPSIDFDNNVYFSPFINDAFKCEGINYDFFSWQSSYSIDDSSSFENPFFGVFGNSSFNNIAIDNTVPKLPEVNFDIDSVTRNTTMCDPGAKEIMFVDLGPDTTICYGETLTLFAPNGISYTWNTSETTQNLTVSNAGTYSVTVQESVGGPIGIDTINVMVNPEIIVQLTNSQDLNCFGDNNGMLELFVSGGVAPYSFTWLGSYPDTNKIENLAAAQYDVNISDANACSVDTFFVVNQPDSIEITFDSPKFCGGCTGFIVPTVVGGTEPYTYTWSSGTTDTVAYDLCEGTYTLTIIDDSLCVATDTYSIVESNLAYIAGTLSYSGGNVAENDGKVELYKHYVDGASQLELADMNTLGINGFFEFTGVEPEEFYLRGIVTSANSIYENIYTSYYLDGGDTTVWEGATALSIACEDTITNLNFVMYELSSSVTGPGTFSGTVTYGDGQAKLAGEPVPGAEVFVEQEPNDEPIANTITDTTGTWNIDNIPVGTGYHLIVDIPGLPLVSTYSSLIVEGGDTINNELNFFVDTLSGGGIFSDTATIIIEVNSQDIEIKTYPNPVSSYLTIETELKSNIDISYQVIDINGREIITKKIGNYQGRFVEQIDMNNFENGVYFIKLKLDNAFYIKKFIKE